MQTVYLFQSQFSLLRMARYFTTFSSEVHFRDELRIVSGDLSLQIECIGHQNENKVGM